MSLTGRGEMSLLRAAALIAVLAGAVGSLGFMLYIGRRQKSLLLIGLFTVWVLAPFAVLVWAHLISKDWTVSTRAALYGVMLVVTLGSLVIYGYVVVGPPKPQPAFFFLVVPPVSWLLIAIALPVAASISGRLPRRG